MIGAYRFIITLRDNSDFRLVVGEKDNRVDNMKLIFVEQTNEKILIEKLSICNICESLKTLA
jgi:hypothetical protein